MMLENSEILPQTGSISDTRGSLSASAASSIAKVSRSSLVNEEDETRAGKFSWKAITSNVTGNLLSSYPQDPQNPSFDSHVLDNLDDSELADAVKELERKLRHLKVENGVYYRFLQSHDPDVLEDIMMIMKGSNRASIASSRRRSSLFARPSKTFRKASGGSMSQLVLSVMQQQAEKDAPKISVNQKSDLVTRDLEENEAKIEQDRKKADKIKCKLTAKLEEILTRKEELVQSEANFQQFKTTEQMSIQKFVRFMDEWSKKSRLMADKVRLRYSSLKVQYQKLAVILAHKQLIGENLHEIDFENLRIENLHLVEKIEKKNLLLIELKRMTGEGNLKLSQNKGILQEKIFEKETVEEAIRIIEKDLVKADAELDKLFPEIDQVKREYERVFIKFHHLEAPDVLIYLRKKVESNNLKKELKTWSQRLFQKKIAMNFELQKMQKLVQSKKQHPSWFA